MQHQCVWQQRLLPVNMDGSVGRVHWALACPALSGTFGQRCAVLCCAGWRPCRRSRQSGQHVRRSLACQRSVLLRCNMHQTQRTSNAHSAPKSLAQHTSPPQQTRCCRKQVGRARACVHVCARERRCTVWLVGVLGARMNNVQGEAQLSGVGPHLCSRRAICGTRTSLPLALAVLSLPHICVSPLGRHALVFLTPRSLCLLLPCPFACRLV